MMGEQNMCHELGEVGGSAQRCPAPQRRPWAGNKLLTQHESHSAMRAVKLQAQGTKLKNDGCRGIIAYGKVSEWEGE